MKNILNRILALTIVLFSFTSCEVIGDIFKAGMGFGIFIVVIIIAIVIYIISKFLGKK
ncbi:hypothetical protein [Flavobacterium aquicola]|uniref:Phosphatidate cytidylyltransferase n=1 Tax=Flavobacterium aquicola TaxID=1682742 RepID=A0A3E0EN21_9FLAO|nr:hypothetical protein [Flavobacterium aquicola]REG99571.1 hypothetical protein C8P67_104193 [Flavobacterium aquicola]